MSVSTTARVTLATALAGLSLGAATTAATANSPRNADAAASVELYAGDQLVDAYECAWTGVPDTDRCMLVVGDGPDQVAFLKGAGVDRASWTTNVPGHDVDAQATLARRADGTWLFEGQSVMGAQTRTFGFVSDANGHNWCATRCPRGRRAPRSSAPRARRRPLPARLFA